MRDGLTHGDHETVMRSAHTLKGVAANLGVERVAELAGQIERLMRDNSGAPNAAFDQLQKLESALQEVGNVLAAQLSPAIASTSSPASEDADDHPEAPETLRQLLQAIDNDLGALSSVMETLRRQLHRTDSIQLLGEIDAHLQQFDTDKAKHAVNTLLESLSRTTKEYAE